MWREFAVRSSAAFGRFESAYSNYPLSLDIWTRIFRLMWPVPIFVDEILRGAFANCAEPLRAERSHPDKVACGDGIPTVAEPIDAAAFEHQQTVLHDVYFDHTECRARLICHGVDRE